MIMMSFQHAANNDPPQSLNQLEYSNTDYMSPNELRTAFRALGSPDYIVCSHSRNGDTRRTERWPSIGCINRRSNKLFKFRVMFPNQAITEQVYSNYHALRRTQSTHEAIPNSFQLRPLSDLNWDQPTRTLSYPPTVTSVTPSSAYIAQVIMDHVFDNTDVDIPGTVATITFYNSDIRDIAWHAWRANPLVVRGHVLAVSALTGPLQQPPPSSALLTCHDCGRLGHIASECTVFQELDDHGRPIRRQATPAPNTPYDPRRDTRPSKPRAGRSRSTYSGPATTQGRSASHSKTQVVASKPQGTAGATLASSDVRRLQERFLRMEAETKRHSEEFAKVKAENAAQQAQPSEQAAQLAKHAEHHVATQQTLEVQARVQAQAAEDRQAMKANIAQAIALLTQAASSSAPLATPPHRSSAKLAQRRRIRPPASFYIPRPFIYTWILLLSLLLTGVTAFPTHAHTLQPTLPLAQDAGIPVLHHTSFRHAGPSSSDDSANSEYSDHRLQATSPVATTLRRSQRGPHRRKPWRPAKHLLSPPQLGTDWSPTDAIHTREARQYESFLGHPVSLPDTRDSVLRVATTNINKNTKTKIYAELGDWFIANQLDFAILEDADLGEQPFHIWCAQTNGTSRPGLATLSASRVAILYDYQRWHSRLQLTATTTSPSGRSIAIHLRLGQRGKLTLLGTYCPASPHTCRTETIQEWDWLAEHTPPPAPRTLVLLAGDFNTYGTNSLDRSSPAQRSHASTAMGEAFESWQQLHNWTSTFRYLHPQIPRYTYTRAGTAVALGDILIQTRTAHSIQASGIWIGSLHSSDHIGTPITQIALDHRWSSSTQLKGVRPIRVVNTRNTTDADMAQFTQHTNHLLQTQLSALQYWWNDRPSATLDSPGPWHIWLMTGWTHWHKVYHSRRRWRTTSQRIFAQRYRTELFTGHHTRRFLQNALGQSTPPISIRSTMVDPRLPFQYAVLWWTTPTRLSNIFWTIGFLRPNALTDLPTSPHCHPQTRPQAPRFVREWILHDMDRPDHIAPGFIHEGQCTWETYMYTPEMQQRCDRHLRKHVAPGYGGVSQELWIAAPMAIRERERLIINTILRTGCVPPCLGRKQMLYLAKTDTAHGIVNLDNGLPPWRPITVQSAFTSRLFMVIRDYITPIIPNEPLQHGFQKDRTVQDAVILTSLLIDRARRTKTELFLTSKDCLKCFDRVPSWVMEYIYLKLGVPPTPRKLMAHFLGASQIDIRTAFGWVDGGHRDFGLGQGSILAVMHTGYYMDLLQQQQQRGLDPIKIFHHQHPEELTHRPIGSLLFVDDALDVATTYAGIQHRAAISNIFTGKYASGGVFGAEKSFMLYLSSHHYPTISLNNGLGEPQPVKVIAPIDGFKHLGIHQGVGAQWAANTQTLWRRLKRQAEQLAPKRLTGAEFRYIVNAVWMPSILYRCALSDSLSIASAFDVLIRKTAKRVLHLPNDHPTEWFYDPMDGLGLHNCELLSQGQRIYQFLRIANDTGSPAYDALMNEMEAYQIQMGLTNNPLLSPIPPPSSDTSFLGTTIRIAAASAHKYTIHATWHSPPECLSTRPCDRSIWTHLSPALGTTLMKINKASKLKVRWLGDITNERGTQLLALETLQLRFGWTAAQLP
ncbi:hypothetical protein AeNC1_016021 [Aphanomyces euteiches]|nr:hypothetical protein AeNC1_016021 [Aphanomyces euteiches]